jgi:hypothetical protein
VAGVTLVSGLYRSCRGHAAFDKASVGGFSSSLPARTFGDEDASRLLAQPALWLKPASSAGCRSDPWDVSCQIALPLAYPDSHPHNNTTLTQYHAYLNLVEPTLFNCLSCLIMFVLYGVFMLCYLCVIACTESNVFY